MYALNLRTHTPPLVRFLTELSRAQCAQVTVFDWGAAAAVPFLPRLRYSRIVLASARWRLEASDLPGRVRLREEWDAALADWRALRRLPRRVHLVEDDRHTAKTSCSRGTCPASSNNSATCRGGSSPKTDNGFRVVALDDDTVDVLERHRKQQVADREEWASAWIETGLVFTQEDGSWLHPGKVTDLFERLAAASGLPSIRLHDLRHGAATLMLAAGIDVKIVSDTLGHSDTRITRDIYQSVLPQFGKNAAEATAKLVPLQRKTAAEEAARKAEKAAKNAKDKAKAEARAKKKGKQKKPQK